MAFEDIQISAEDQREYDAGMARLQELSRPDPKALAAMRAVEDQLADVRCPMHLITAVESAYELVDRAFENPTAMSADIADQKPEKPTLYAAFAVHANLAWNIIAEKLPELSKILEDVGRSEGLNSSLLAGIMQMELALIAWLQERYKEIQRLTTSDLFRAEPVFHRLGEVDQLADILMHMHQGEVTPSVVGGSVQGLMLKGLEHAALSTIGEMTILPMIFRAQFKKVITTDEWLHLIQEQRQVVIRESLMSMTGFNNGRRKVVPNPEKPAIISAVPDRYVIGKKANGKFGTAIRGSVMKGVVDDAESPQMGCVMTHVVGDLYDAVRNAIEPVIREMEADLVSGKYEREAVALVELITGTNEQKGKAKGRSRKRRRNGPGKKELKKRKRNKKKKKK